MPKQIAKQLLRWYLECGRKNLPWRQSLSPYRVWVSEIMLQQTQVTTVIPYFIKFMHRFPDVYQLAEAKLDDVLHLWSGLGYYSRARNLHRTAQLIVSQYGATFPKTVTELCELPGIGYSTAGAIAAISYHTHAAILDGNVKRVLARLYTLESWPGESKIQNQLWQWAEELTPKKSVNVYTQAIMDFGAVICTRRQPNCHHCPIQSQCDAYAKKLQHQLPLSKPKKNKPEKSVAMLIIKNDQNKVLLIKRPLKGIWGGLWSFPEVEAMSHLKSYCNKTLKLFAKRDFQLTPFRHSFSHYHLNISPVVLSLSHKKTKVRKSQNRYWLDLSNPSPVGLPAPVQRIINTLMSEEKTSYGTNDHLSKAK